MAVNNKTRDDDARGGGAKGVRGNPPHERSDHIAAQVEKLAALQVTQREAAQVVGVSEDTIQRHYADEWERGRMVMTAKLKSHLYERAFGKLKNPDEPDKGYVKGAEPSDRMAIFLAEAQHGMRRTSRHEFVNGPLANNNAAADAVKERLDQLAERDGE